MADESVTVAAALHVVKLVDRVWRIADPADARELASRVADAVEHPDRPVADAFRIAPSRDRRELCAIWRATDRSGNKLQPFARRPVVIVRSRAIRLRRASAVSCGNLSKSVRSI